MLQGAALPRRCCFIVPHPIIPPWSRLSLSSPSGSRAPTRMRTSVQNAFALPAGTPSALRPVAELCSRPHGPSQPLLQTIRQLNRRGQQRVAFWGKPGPGAQPSSLCPRPWWSDRLLSTHSWVVSAFITGWPRALLTSFQPINTRARASSVWPAWHCSLPGPLAAGAS